MLNENRRHLRSGHLIGRYSKLTWKDQSKQAEAIVLICGNLQAPHALPVRLEAAAAISRLVRDEAVLDFVRPQIPLIFSNFFASMTGNSQEIPTTPTRSRSLFAEDLFAYSGDRGNSFDHFQDESQDDSQ